MSMVSLLKKPQWTPSTYNQELGGLEEEPITLLEKFLRISLYVTDDAIANFYETKCLGKSREIIENLVTGMH